MVFLGGAALLFLSSQCNHCNGIKIINTAGKELVHAIRTQRTVSNQDQILIADSEFKEIGEVRS